MWDLETLHNQQIFSDLDVHFAQFIGKLANSKDEILYFSAALLSCLRHNGHICLDLEQLAGQVIPLEGDALPTCPNLQTWLASLQQSEHVVGDINANKPLILEQQRLYLQRYWQYETRLVDWLIQRSSETCVIHDQAKLKAGVKRLFPNKTLDWQKIAALTAVLKPFCIISGGPGTGKTTTVAKILALLLEQPTEQPLRIALAAPTGKAAARLQESIASVKLKLACKQAVKDLIPEDSYTLHRLLGVIPNSPYFRHNRHHPLLVDVVIVDEASMVDLALLTKLVEAMPPWARLILLGDKDQLASVEVGAVLGDICQHEVLEGYSDEFIKQLACYSPQVPDATLSMLNSSIIQDNVVLLRKSYRFRGESGIGQLAQKVNQGDGESALWLMQQAHYDDINWYELGSSQVTKQHLQAVILQGYANYLNESSPEKILQKFAQFRVLAVHRHGAAGVQSLNQVIESVLADANIIKRSRGQWYHGQPIMITENDHHLRLYNGDVGMILYDSNKQRLSACFQTTDHLQSVRYIPLVRLPTYQTVYAMTVHKSQGSEFDHVLLILPEQHSPILGRELIYTGITRAKQKVSIVGHQAVLKLAVGQQSRRMSGVAIKL